MFHVERPTATTEPPWGWGREFSPSEQVIVDRAEWLESKRLWRARAHQRRMLRAMEKLGVPAIAPPSLGSTPSKEGS